MRAQLAARPVQGCGNPSDTTTCPIGVPVIRIATASLVALALAVPTAPSASTTTCVRVGQFKICRTKHKRYDKVCVTTYLDSFSFTKCHRERHR